MYSFFVMVVGVHLPSFIGFERLLIISVIENGRKHVVSIKVSVKSWCSIELIKP
jgi:hypothetical protein